MPKDTISDVSKKEHGQFNTTNVDYILSGMKLRYKPKKIVEPCYGDGDLIKFIKNTYSKDIKIIEKYDIDPSKDAITQDTLLKPINYTNSLLMMNPPYLSNVQNKLDSNKQHYKTFKRDDLYKCYIQTMINIPPVEFMIIIPLNFLCSIRKNDQNLRKEFFNIFKIQLINIFNEQVFSDTTYNVCAIHGILNKLKTKTTTLKSYKIKTIIYPEKKKIQISLNEENNYCIGGEIYNIPIDKTLVIDRAVGLSNVNVSNLYLKTIDDNANGTTEQKISLSIKDHPEENIFFGKISDRSYCYIKLNPMKSLKIQEKIVALFNENMNNWRVKYDSLFLTNFRDKGRKRISFELGYRIINHCYTLIDDESDKDEGDEDKDEKK